MQIDLVQLIVTLAIFGLVYWIVVTYIPMPEPVRRIVTVLCAVLACVWLLQFVGIGRGVWIR